MSLQKIEERMQSARLSPQMVHEFLRRARLVQAGATGKVPWQEIQDLRSQDYLAFKDLPEANPSLYGRLAVIKLNGGLGTSMGLDRAKSLMEVKTGLSFLDIIKNQVLALRKSSGQFIPCLFMNSYNTRDDTLAWPGIQELNEGQLPVDFLQHKVPRLLKSDLTPLGDGKSDAHWCPPGHGDVYLALSLSGILEQLLARGRQIAFISNGDNLGATANLSILGAMLELGLDFAMEITPKTLADLKGGVLFRHTADGHNRIELLETAQVEEGHERDFEDTARFAYFSTNNLWIQLEALRDKIRAGLPLSLIVNPKQVEGQDILQLEAAMGSAIGHFENTRGIVVPRARFAPVKSCADLLVRRSDAYVLQEDCQLVMDPSRLARGQAEPHIVLSDHYKKIKDFERLVPCIPSLRAVDELVVQGPVLFDVPVEIKGRVAIVASGPQPLPISKAGQASFADTRIHLEN